MKNVIYSKTLLPASESPDGETPVKILVTEEVNGYAVWILGWDGPGLLRFGVDRDLSIEWAVMHAQDHPPVQKALEEAKGSGGCK